MNNLKKAANALNNSRNKVTKITGYSSNAKSGTVSHTHVMSTGSFASSSFVTGNNQSQYSHVNDEELLDQLLSVNNVSAIAKSSSNMQLYHNAQNEIAIIRSEVLRRLRLYKF
jgi:hypothetical protein